MRRTLIALIDAVSDGDAIASAAAGRELLGATVGVATGEDESPGANGVAGGAEVAPGGVALSVEDGDGRDDSKLSGVGLIV